MDASQEFVLPREELLAKAQSSIISELPPRPQELTVVRKHIVEDIALGLTKSASNPHYFGFVTGGVTAVALEADKIVSEFDQNAAVHLPNDGIATDVEDAALRMLLQLYRFDESQWAHRIFTTGATASNVLGLALGREHVVQRHAQRQGREISIAEDGIMGAMGAAGLQRIQILTTRPHSSLRKAASVVGLGRACIVEVGQEHDPLRFDLAKLKSMLAQPNTASIVVVSCGEINTGFFATRGGDMAAISAAAREHDAWVHVDAAFGLQASCLELGGDFDYVLEGVRGIDLADSITSDAHKLLNVPYDCGIFFSKHLDLAQQVFQNPGAAYLSSGATNRPSPLNIGLENSRRFRALPVYANLVAYGRSGLQAMLTAQITLARAIASWILTSDVYELLPSSPPGHVDVTHIYMVVLFRAKDPARNRRLTASINATRKIYVSGTEWEGQPATRIAVSHWRVSVPEDAKLVQEVLGGLFDGEEGRA